MYRARGPSDEAAGYHRETISSRRRLRDPGIGRAVSLSHTDVVPAGYGPVGSGRPGTATRITDSTATSPGQDGNVLPFQAAVEGLCDPGFEPVRDAFRANFAERGELGAAVCVMVGDASSRTSTAAGPTRSKAAAGNPTRW